MSSGKFSHGQTKRYKCTEPNCGEKFKRIGNLRKHKKFVHGIMILWKCTTCSKIFAWKDNCERHVSKCSNQDDSKARQSTRNGKPIKPGSNGVEDNFCNQKLFNNPATRTQQQMEGDCTDSLKEWDNQTPAKIVEPSVKIISTSDNIPSDDKGNADASTVNGPFLMVSSSEKSSADEQLVSDLDVIPTTSSVITSSADQPPCETIEKQAYNQAFPEIEKSVFEDDDGIQRYMFGENDQPYKVKVVRGPIVKCVAKNSVQRVEHFTESQPVEFSSGLRSSVTSTASHISNSKVDEQLVYNIPHLFSQTESVISYSEDQIPTTTVPLELHTQASTNQNDNNELNGNTTSANCIIKRINNEPSVRTEFLCEICGKLVFSLKSHKWTHMSKKEQDEIWQNEPERIPKSLINRKWECLECDKSYQRYSNLKLHTSTYHKANGPPNEKCPKCGMYVLDLKNHVEYNHVDPYRFVCTEPDCEKKYKTRRMLKQHKENVHEKLRPWKCTMCTKPFYWKLQFMEHMDLHFGKRRWKCAVEGCKAAFVIKATLKNHQKKFHEEGSKPGRKTFQKGRYSVRIKRC